MIMELRRSVITGEICARPAIMADRSALGPVRSPAARAAGTRCCNCCASAAPTRRSPTRPARPPLPDPAAKGRHLGKTHAELVARNLRGHIARKGEKAPIQASQRWHMDSPGLVFSVQWIAPPPPPPAPPGPRGKPAWAAASAANDQRTIRPIITLLTQMGFIFTIR
ncbi:hypothetical protein ALMP_72230 [Streptomyces sp. A012304]|nr:hypothetical protein ALMP_72230 [Streptomyces sp. A012304]